jgi:hypothetical protein
MTSGQDAGQKIAGGRFALNENKFAIINIPRTEPRADSTSFRVSGTLAKPPPDSNSNRRP